MPVASKWRIFVVDDEAARTREIKELFDATAEDEDSDGFAVIECNDFSDGLTRLQDERFDILVLDLRQGEGCEDEQAGMQLLGGLKNLKFIPVIFYTGLPHLVRHLESGLVRVVEKTEGATRVFEVCKEILSTKIPGLNRAVTRHIDLVQARYMWRFVEPKWDTLNASLDRSELAHLLIRRLAMFLSTESVDAFANELGHTARAEGEEPKVHPMRFYILPVLEGSSLRTGEIVLFADARHRVLLTPSCDVAQRKADSLLWAECVPLHECQEYVKWSDAQGNTGEKDLCQLFRNRRAKQPERYFYLPAALCLPDLVVDLQHLTTTDGPELDGDADRIASLDSPYAEALSAQFLRFYGRVGTPDLSISTVLQRLRQSCIE